MANAINYAEKWQEDIIEIMIQGTLSAPFITTNVNWLNAKTFHFTQMAVGGYKNHALTGGWNRQNVTQTDVPFTLSHDRDVEFLLDKREVDESNETASIRNVSMVFQETQANPEIDAYFFSTVATKALATAGYFSATDIATYTKTNVYGKLKGFIAAGKLRRYRNNGSLVMYVVSTIMDLLEQSEDFTRQINIESVGPNGTGLETRVTDMDGVPIIEVIDDERFYTAFDFTDGFVPAVGDYKINVLIASLTTVKTVPKISSIYAFAPGTHTEGDGYLYQNRAFWDTFIMPNGKDGNIDSIYCDRDTTAVV